MNRGSMEKEEIRDRLKAPRTVDGGRASGRLRRWLIPYIPRMMRSPAFWTWPMLGLVLSPPLVHAHPSTGFRIDQLRRRLEANPEDARLFVKRARVNREAGHWHAALVDLERALRLEPDNIDARVLYARTLIDAKRVRRGLEELKRIPETKRPIEAIFVEAEGLHALGQPVRAADRLREAEDHWPGETPPPPDFYFKRATWYAQGGPKWTLRAIEVLDEGMSRLGDLIALQSLAIELEERRGAWDKALERIERVRQTVSNPGKWLVREGEILVKAGRYGEARQALDDASTALSSLPPSRQESQSVRRLRERIASARARLDDRPSWRPAQ